MKLASLAGASSTARRRLLFPMTVIGALSVAAAGWATTISDNFDDGDDTAPTIAWQRYDPIGASVGTPFAHWSFPGGNTYRIQADPSPDVANAGPGRAGSFATNNFTNFYVAVDVVNWDPTVHQFFGVLARVGTPGPGTTSGYLFGWDTGDPTNPTAGDMDIVRLDNESATDLDGHTYFGNDSVHLQTNHTYRFVFMGVGATFRGQVFDLTNTAVPIVDYGTTDPAYDPNGTDHLSGATGLLVANNCGACDGSADATFDNFLATDEQLLYETFPLLSISMPSPTAVNVSWPGVGNGATHVLTTNLQSSPALSPPLWTPVTNGITQNGVENVYLLSSPTGSQFFKLVLP
jgi:hypothetical protein